MGEFVLSLRYDPLRDKYSYTLLTQMNHQIINVNFEDFLRTGVFGAIEFGMTRDQIQNLLGAPDFVFTTRKSRKPTGFEYGDIEFYFDSSKENRLSGIYLDEFDVPKGSKFLHIDAWCLRAEMSQAKVESALTQANISFMPTEMPSPTMNGIVTEGGVELGFIKKVEEFSPPAGLYNISCSLRSLKNACLCDNQKASQKQPFLI